LSRLKEGERVCGGRGQFGDQPLWDLNRILILWRRHGNTEPYKSAALWNSLQHRVHRV